MNGLYVLHRTNSRLPLCFFGCQESGYWPGHVSADAVVMSGVRCSGTEMSLSHCLHHGEYLHCPRGGGRFAAGVSCSESEFYVIKLHKNHTPVNGDRHYYVIENYGGTIHLSFTSSLVAVDLLRHSSGPLFPT